MPTFIPRGTGKAFEVRTGQVFHLEQAAGGQQVADVNIFNLADPTEQLWTAATARQQSMHIDTGAELISTPPAERPIMRLVANTMKVSRSPRGTLPHDVMVGRCTQKNRGQRYGPENATPGCQENLAGAIAAFGLPASMVHNPFNAFMRTMVDEQDRPIFEPSDAEPGDYIELLALVDCLVAVSACPGQSSGPAATGLLAEVWPGEAS